MDALSDHPIDQALAQWVQTTGAKRLVMAYSGGLDSHVLLHACHALQKKHLRFVSPFSLRAIHVNHQLQASAKDFETHCKQVCHALNIPLTCLQASGKPMAKQSIEDWARNMRYRLIQENIEEDEIVLTAQTQDDQAETILLQLMRGSGIKGLASMGMMKPFGGTTLYRPLLECTRAQIESYAKHHDLQWIEDSTNQQTHFMRNFLRHEIFPKLEGRVPGVKQSMARSARHIAEANTVLTELADSDAKEAICSKTDALNPLKIAHLSKPRLKNVIRHWIQQKGHPLLSTAKLETFFEQMKAKEDAQPLIRWQNSSLRRFKSSWYLQKEFSLNKAYEVLWEGQASLKLPCGYTLAFEKVKGQGLNLPKGAKLTVKTRSNNPKLKPAGECHSKTLKKWWQHFNIPPWKRDSWPLVYIEDSLVMIPGMFMVEGFQATADETGLVIQFC